MVENRANEFEGRPELVKKRARSIFGQAVVVALVVVVVLAALSILTINAIQSFKTRNTILDCTQINGTCHKESLRQTGIFLNKLVNANHNGDVKTQRITLAAAICSSKPENAGNQAKITACVNAQLKVKR